MKKNNVQTREGLIPTALGIVVTTTGFVLRRTLPGYLAWTIIGFGLAHIVLGTIDLAQDEYGCILEEVTKK